MYTPNEVFMAKRIIAGLKDYTAVITARPDMKTGIDEYLSSVGEEELIVEVK